MGWLLAAAPVLAHPPVPANVNFTSEHGVPFGLVLDGRPLTRGVARQVHVDQLQPGAHWAEFTVPTSYGGAVRFRSRVWLQPGLETSFVLLARPGRPLDLRQVSAVAVYGRGRGYGNSYGYSNSPQPYNSPSRYGQGPSGYPAPQGGYGPGQTGSTGSYPNGGNNNYPGSGSNGNYPNNGSGYPGGNSQGGYQNGGNGQSGYPNGNNGNTGNNGQGGYYPGTATSSYRTLPPQELNGLVQAVQRQRFDADKLRTAKEALAQSALPTDDLKRLLLTLDFEPSRLELAKFGYDHVTDPQNFERVYDAFNFEASKQELDEAINEEPEN
ncbi:hypothetical protein GCM10022409_05810 [Hymenobacter glaciei]|uniref:DUF4476 domain-containing protein n=2 Tax=Hymenobacter glaciei TaxID=877209 RepID=A0ABP7TDC4_9BACT